MLFVVDRLKVSITTCLKIILGLTEYRHLGNYES